MSDDVKVSMLLCRGLVPAEQEKIERLDGPISERLFHAGLPARICQGSGDGENRVLSFCDPSGTVATVSADRFLSAADDDAVASIAIR